MKKPKRLPDIITILIFILYTLISIPLELLGFWRCFNCGKIGWIYKDRVTEISMTGDEVHFCKECSH
jgi:hypothetical protein